MIFLPPDLSAKMKEMCQHAHPLHPHACVCVHVQLGATVHVSAIPSSFFVCLVLFCVLQSFSPKDGTQVFLLARQALY